MESVDLISLEVTNSSTRSKYLAICSCWKLRELTLDVESLVSFEFCYNKSDSNVAYKNVPSLTEACFGGNCCKALIPNFRQITYFSAYLSKLSLDMKMVDEEYHTIPTFLNVNHLELIVNASPLRSLPALRCIPETCPLFHHLRLKGDKRGVKRWGLYLMLGNSEGMLDILMPSLFSYYIFLRTP